MNKELLLKVNAWVQQEDAKGRESEWKQHTWSCGTSCCFAGKVVLEAGGYFVDSATGLQPLGSTASCVYQGQQRSIREAATDILGIDEWEAQTLFSGDNDAADIDRLVHQFVTKRNVHERCSDSDRQVPETEREPSVSA